MKEWMKERMKEWMNKLRIGERTKKNRNISMVWVACGIG